MLVPQLTNFLLAQVGLLPALLKVVSEKWVLVLALASSTLQLVGFATAPTLGGWAVWVSLVVGAPGCMSMPVISALKSVHSGEDEQGKVQVCTCHNIKALVINTVVYCRTQKSSSSSLNVILV